MASSRRILLWRRDSALDGKPAMSVKHLLRAVDADEIDRTVDVDFLHRSEQLSWIGPVSARRRRRAKTRGR